MTAIILREDREAFEAANLSLAMSIRRQLDLVAKAKRKSKRKGRGGGTC